MERRGDIAELTEEEIAALVDGLRYVALDLGRVAPTPRGAPFFGLDMLGAESAGGAVLDRFLRSGIFRKYEHAAVLGSPLGAAARWWSVRGSCTVTTVGERRLLAAAAGLLSRHAGSPRVRTACGSAPDLPLRSGFFTHVWCLGEARAGCGWLAEARRILRRGGELGALVDDEIVGACREELQRVGFTGVATEPVVVDEPPAHVAAARERLRRYLENRSPYRITPRLVRVADRLGRPPLDRALVHVTARPG